MIECGIHIRKIILFITELKEKTIKTCWNFYKFSRLLSTKDYSILANLVDIRHRKDVYRKDRLSCMNTSERATQAIPDSFWRDFSGISKVPQKSKIWAGFNYSLNQEKYLKVFLDDGEVLMDNNAAEQLIWGFFIGKKNWVVIDTVAGAKSSALIGSFWMTCSLGHRTSLQTAESPVRMNWNKIGTNLF